MASCPLFSHISGVEALCPQHLLDQGPFLSLSLGTKQPVKQGAIRQLCRDVNTRHLNQNHSAPVKLQWTGLHYSGFISHPLCSNVDDCKKYEKSLRFWLPSLVKACLKVSVQAKLLIWEELNRKGTASFCWTWGGWWKCKVLAASNQWANFCQVHVRIHKSLNIQETGGWGEGILNIKDIRSTDYLFIYLCPGDLEHEFLP